MSIKISVQISAREAIKAGKAYDGCYGVELTSEHLEELTASEREFLASLYCEVPDGLSTVVHALNSSDAPALVEPTPEALLAWVKATSPLVQEAVERRAEITKTNDRRREEAREQAKRRLLDYLETTTRSPLVRETRDEVTVDIPEAEAPSFLFSYKDAAAGRNVVNRLDLWALRADERFAVHFKKAEKLVEKKRAEMEERERAAAAAKEEAERVEREDRAQWIGEHGSDRLKKALELDVLDTCDKLYVEERLAHELPAWRLDPADSVWKDVKNPSLELLEAFEIAQDDERLRDVSLSFVVWDDQKWAAVTASYRGRLVILPVEDRS